MPSSSSSSSWTEVSSAHGYAKFWTAAYEKAQRRRPGSYCVQLKPVVDNAFRWSSSSPPPVLLQPQQQQQPPQQQAPAARPVQERWAMQEEIRRLLRCYEDADAFVGDFEDAVAYEQEVLRQEHFKRRQQQAEEARGAAAAPASAEANAAANAAAAAAAPPPPASAAPADAVVVGNGHAGAPSPSPSISSSNSSEVVRPIFSSASSSNTNRVLSTDSPPRPISSSSAAAAAAAASAARPAAPPAAAGDSDGAAAAAGTNVVTNVVTVEQVSRRLRYVIFGPETRKMLQPVHVDAALTDAARSAQAAATAAGGPLPNKRKKMNGAGQGSPGRTIAAGGRRLFIGTAQYPSILALLQACDKQVRAVAGKFSELKAVARKKQTGNRVGNRAKNRAVPPVDGMAHGALWHAYAVTAGIVMSHSEWYEEFPAEAAGEEEDEDEEDERDGGTASAQTQLGRIGVVLTSVWRGVLALPDRVLAIDAADRKALSWWLDQLRRVFAATTTRRSRPATTAGTNAGPTGWDAPALSFEFRPAGLL